MPFGSINPKLPDWQEDVRRCARDYGMPGLRLHPNYHGYELKDPVFAELLHAAAASGLMVQLVVAMEDTRTQHPLMRVPPVDLLPLAQVLKSQPEARVMLLNWWPAIRVQQIGALAGIGTLYFDFAMLEGIEGVARLVEQVPPERVLFGSNFPLFNFEAAVLKMQESGLPEVTKAMLFEGNARILPSSKANPA